MLKGQKFADAQGERFNSTDYDRWPIGNRPQEKA